MFVLINLFFCEQKIVLRYGRIFKFYIFNLCQLHGTSTNEKGLFHERISINYMRRKEIENVKYSLVDDSLEIN